MKTRTLLLLAVACGVAVLAAGTALMFKLGNQANVAPAHVVNEAVPVGDVTVTLRKVDAAIDDISVVVDVSAAPATADTGPRPLRQFSVITGGKVVLPELNRQDCPRITTTPTTCRLRFSRQGAVGLSATMIFSNDKQSANWLLTSQ